MDIAAQSPIVAGIFNQKRFITSLVKMSGSLVSFRVPVGVSGKPMLHSAGKIWLGSLDQRMHMIRHPAIGQDNPATTLDLFLKPSCESLVVPQVMEQTATPITACDDVVVCAGELDPGRSRHCSDLYQQEELTLPTQKTEHKA